MSDLNIALILTLIDNATKPAKKAIDNLTGSTRKGSAAAAGAGASLGSMGLRAGVAGATIAALGAAVVGSSRAAVNFESAMADVAKVLDMDPTGIETLSADILNLSTRLPIAKEDIAAIVAAAGQAGVVDKLLPDNEERRQILAFAEDAARMAVAFEISPDAAGATMVAMRNRLKLTQDEVLDLGDAINHLGDNSGAGAAAIQQGAIERLGMSAVDLSRRMQEDAKGAIFDVLEAIRELDRAVPPGGSCGRRRAGPLSRKTSEPPFPPKPVRGPTGDAEGLGEEAPCATRRPARARTTCARRAGSRPMTCAPSATARARGRWGSGPRTGRASPSSPS